MTPSWWSQWRGPEPTTIRKRRSPWQRRSSTLWERCEPRTLLSLSITAASPTVVQDVAGGTAASFSVALNQAHTDQTVAVDFHTVDGSARANVDYTPTRGTLSFAPGQTTASVVVPILGGSDAKGGRDLSLVLSNPVNDNITQGQARVTLVPLPGSTNGNSGSQTPAPISPSKDAPASHPSASQDKPTTTPLAEPARGASATLTGDHSNSNQAGILRFGASEYDVSQDVGKAVITVNRAGGDASGVSIHYATGGGTAVAGKDYTPTSGTLTFGANETSQSFTVPILANLLLGGD